MLLRNIHHASFVLLLALARHSGDAAIRDAAIVELGRRL